MSKDVQNNNKTNDDLRKQTDEAQPERERQKTESMGRIILKEINGKIQTRRNNNELMQLPLELSITMVIRVQGIQWMGYEYRIQLDKCRKPPLHLQSIPKLLKSSA